MTVYPLVRAGGYAPDDWGCVWLSEEAARYALRALYPTLLYTKLVGLHHAVCAADDRPPPAPRGLTTHAARLLGRPAGLRVRLNTPGEVAGFAHLLGEPGSEHPIDPEKFR